MIRIRMPLETADSRSRRPAEAHDARPGRAPSRGPVRQPPSPRGGPRGVERRAGLWLGALLVGATWTAQVARAAPDEVTEQAPTEADGAVDEPGTPGEGRDAAEPRETVPNDAAEPRETPPDEAASLPTVQEPAAATSPATTAEAAPDPGGFKRFWKAERTAPPKPQAAETWTTGCVDCSVPFTGDKWRTRGPAAWFRRTAADWLAMPATVKTWGAPGWLTFSAFTAASVVPMLPLNPSLDVRLQDYIRGHRSERADKAFVHINTKQIVSGIIVYEALILGTGWATGNERLLEYGGLVLEAVADVQFYHLLSKLLLGREGPGDGEHQGKVHGPKKFFFPSGTPSGHTATLYAVLTVSAEYADSWALRVFSHLASLYFGASLIYHGAHFVSDVIWGAAMGYFMGQWVMKYRSSRRECEKAGRKLSLRERIKWTPVVSQHGAMLGASLSL